jgi:hypothetical protein
MGNNHITITEFGEDGKETNKTYEKYVAFGFDDNDNLIFKINCKPEIFSKAAGYMESIYKSFLAQMLKGEFDGN